MAEQAMFNEKEVLFIEKTGKKFTDIYRVYYPKLIYFTSKICNDSQKAEDITTESLLTALDKIEKYDSEKSQFSTWLFTIAKNLSLQGIKFDRRSISLDIEYDDEGTTMKDFITQDDDNVLIKQDVSVMKSKIIKNYMEQIKEPYKTVLEMRELKNMAYQDIADELGRNLSTVKSQIRNGRQILILQTKKEFKKIDELYL